MIVTKNKEWNEKEMKAWRAWPLVDRASRGTKSGKQHIELDMGTLIRLLLLVLQLQLVQTQVVIPSGNVDETKYEDILESEGVSSYKASTDMVNNK